MAMGEQAQAALVIDDGDVRLEELTAVARGGRQVCLSAAPAWAAKLQRSRAALESALQAGRPVYGVSTGVGFDSTRRIAPAEHQDLAYQIIRQHGCGVGPPLGEVEGRAILCARLVSLAKGFSAVRPVLLEALCNLLNRGVIPVIPALGSVGASGDLTPLSYVAAVLAGEREAYLEGRVIPADAALARTGLAPHRFEPKESLAIMNGTSVMTAIGALAAERFGRILVLCEQASALAAEILYGRSLAYHPTAHRLKPHPGQMAAAAAIRTALAGSRLMDSGKGEARLIQDPYSLRCAPHVLGAARDALAWTCRVLHCELNSVNDNPIVDPEGGETIFAGNFYGGHVAITMDLLKIVSATVADLLDRQFALLVDSRLNMGLSETLVTYPGCGLKGLQITCSALAARTVQRCASDAALSRPTEVCNQDKVSMGLNAALNASETVTLLQQVLATLLVALSNAAALREAARFSRAATELLERVRAISPVLTADRRLDHDLRRLAQAIDDGFENRM